MEGWNGKTGKVKPGARNAARINSFISSKEAEAEAEAISLEMETKSRFITAYDLKSRILGRPPEDFYEFMAKRSAVPSSELSVGTIRLFNCILIKVANYRDGQQIGAVIQVSKTDLQQRVDKKLLF